MSEQGRPNLWKRINVAPPTQGDSPEVWEYVPVEPDYEAMADLMPGLIDVAAWWTRDNRIELAKKLWRVGIGGSDDKL